MLQSSTALFRLGVLFSSLCAPDLSTLHSFAPLSWPPIAHSCRSNEWYVVNAQNGRRQSHLEIMLSFLCTRMSIYLTDRNELLQVLLENHRPGLVTPLPYEEVLRRLSSMW